MVAIKKLRVDRGITQTALAKQLGVLQSTVAMWENGTNNPRADTLVQLSQILGVTVDDLLKDEVD